jgi:hypothetical protein
LHDFLARYGSVPLTAGGITAIIEDRNRREGQEDHTNYEQAHEAALSEATTNLEMLRALDRGETELVRKMLFTLLNVDVGFLPQYRQRSTLSAEQITSAEDLARDYLSYLEQTTNHFSVLRLDFQMALHGLADLLEDREDLERLVRLLRRLTPTDADQAAPHATPPTVPVSIPQDNMDSPMQRGAPVDGGGR